MISILVTVVGLFLSMFLVGFTFTFIFYSVEDVDLVERVSLGFGLSLGIVILTGFLLGVNDQVAGFWQLVTGAKGISKLNVWLSISGLTILFVLLALYRRNSLRFSKFAEWSRGFQKRKVTQKALLKFAERVKTHLLLIVVVVFAIFIRAYPLYHFNFFAESESAKAIFWAKRIMNSYTIPNYNMSPLIDFYADDFDTPGLHVFVAFIGLFSDFPLINIIGIVTVLEAIVASLLIYTIAHKMTGNKTVSALALFFSCLALPFLRYTNEPGFHFQNLFGEVLIFLIIVLIIRILDGNRAKISIPLLGLSLFSLLVTHQLSTYVFLFIVFVCLLPVVGLRGRAIASLFRRHPWVIIGSVILTLLLSMHSLFTVMWPTLNAFLHHGVGTIGAGRYTGPFFTIKTPSFVHYVDTFGTYYLTLSFIGISICVLNLIKAKAKRFHTLFLLSWLLAVLVLSQGPLLHINIKPFRVVHYVSAPLAVFSSIGTFTILERVFDVLSKIRLKIRKHTPKEYMTVSVSLIIISMLCFSVSVTVLKAHDKMFKAFDYAESSSNSGMMNPETHRIVTWLEQNTRSDDRILVDRWGSTRLSWIFASGRVTSLRVGGSMMGNFQLGFLLAPNIPERRTVYIHKLNFEKIFMMGNNKIAAHLFDKYNFSYLVVEKNAETAFSNNTSFSQVLRTENFIVYEFDVTSLPIVDSDEIILLNPDTLANDLGDLNDFMTESEAYVDPSSRFKEIYLEGATAQMSTDSPIYLGFNLGRYVNDIWDKDGDHIPDGNLTLLMRLYDNDVQSDIYTRRGSEWDYKVIRSAIIGNNTQSWKVRKFFIENRSVWIGQGKLSIMLQVDTSKDPLILDWIALGLEKSALE